MTSVPSPMVQLFISVLEWPALVRLINRTDARSRYPELHAVLDRLILSIELHRETGVAVHAWLLEHARDLGTSTRPSDRTDGRHIRDVAERLQQALGGSRAA